jgi:predicted nucleic acid-binding protein
LVLDIRVWLDWLVFADAGMVSIRRAAETGKATVFTSPACMAELTRVLGYSLSGCALCADGQASALVLCRAIACDAKPCN